MAAAATYRQFLASPSKALLADDASLHYLPTTTSIMHPDKIISHLNFTQKQIIKKKEEILHLVQSESALALETDTGLEFQTSGGPYLPGLDDNFLTDRLVFLPITHFVLFAEDGKILQIRLSWDQAALLKQLDIIGKSGRNWPIKDSREQIKLIESCLKASGVTSASTKGHKEILTTARGSSTNVLRDPHATLHIQASREEVESAKNEQVVSPYGGNRPHQRSFMDVLGDEAEGSDSANLSRQRNMSPAKAGSNKHFQPMRIFDGQDEHVEDEDTPKERNASQFLRPNPKKYNHFDLADGTDPQDAPIAGVSFKDKPKSRHDSQWSFEDVVTPSKPRPSKSTRSQDVRHWDTDNATYAGETPIQGGKGRRDANTQFELQDDGERVAHADKPGARGRGTVQNEQLGLYKNKLFDENEDGAEPERALGNITNLGHRGKDFDPHFRMADESPSNQAHTQKQKENTRLGKPQDDAGIHIAGDGMGGKKGTNRDWLYGGEGEQELPKPTTARRAAHPNSQSSKQSSLWDF